MRNHLGTYECKLCLTLHNNEASYLAHTQGKKHQSNLARRAAKEAKDTPIQPSLEKPRVDIKKFVKIGRPGYRVTKQRDPENGQQSLMFEIDYPEIADGVNPRHRYDKLMSEMIYMLYWILNSQKKIIVLLDCKVERQSFFLSLDIDQVQMLHGEYPCPL